MPAWRSRAEDLSRRSHELLSFLVDVLKVDPQPSRLDARATYHDSCAGLREMGVNFVRASSRRERIKSAKVGPIMCERRDQ